MTRLDEIQLNAYLWLFAGCAVLASVICLCAISIINNDRVMSDIATSERVQSNRALAVEVVRVQDILKEK